MSDAFPPPMSAEDAVELRRRQRGRNWAVLAALIVVAALLYAIAVVRFKIH